MMAPYPIRYNTKRSRGPLNPPVVGDIKLGIRQWSCRRLLSRHASGLAPGVLTINTVKSHTTWGGAAIEPRLAAPKALRGAIQPNGKRYEICQ